MSASSNPSRNATNRDNHSIKATKTTENTHKITMSRAPIVDHTPATTPAENAEYTTMTIEPRSTSFVAFFAANSATLPHRRANCPKINGNNS